MDFSIAELNATAAGIGLGDMLFGFDGGKAANLFTEDAKGITAVIGSTRDHIKPGERFLAQIRCKQGKAEFFLNGKPVGSIACGIQFLFICVRGGTGLRFIRLPSMANGSVWRIRMSRRSEKF